MKRIKILTLFLLALLQISLFAQEIPYRKSGLKYDFRALLLEAQDHNFDVLHYQFEWEIDFSSRRIDGKAVVKARSLTPGLDTIILHFADNMIVNFVSQNQISLQFLHQNGTLEIFFPQTYNLNEEFEVEIFYQGFPQSGLYFSYHQNQPIIWSLDEPIGARNWFPCYDLPFDKATADIQITVPANMIAASNGTLVEVIDNTDNTKTYVWKEDYPVATYLLSVAATNYEIFSDYYYSDSDTMEVFYYVYPEHLPLAQEDFSVTVPMIEFFSDVFGEYPFLNEKYAMAIIPGSTSMEHQTCTSYAANIVRGNHDYDYIVAHELAHQWWGDLITPTVWADIWLNEGFATYSDALWQEHIHGFEGLKTRVARFREIYFDHGDSEHPIYDPPDGHLFCEIEYEKAALVLHMLRFVVGDENFLSILKKYAQDYAYSNVTTEDFRNVCEDVYGANLGWFFNQWIYEAGYPFYQFGWGHTGETTVRVVINQIQQDFPLFKMPIELHIVLPSGTVKQTVWVEDEKNTFSLFFPERPLNVLFDPDGWGLWEMAEFFKKGKGRR